MKKWSYYNEIDPYAAQWIRNLIAAKLIPDGEVDERDIRDIKPDDLGLFAHCHFFAGVAVWAYSLRQAGWSDDRPIWTGSCPCQPFSAAGRAGGFTDERHLWPHWHWLIEQCRPAVVVGEQVASKDGLGWFDLVSADLEGSGYTVGASDLCAAGIGVEWQESQSGEWLRRAIHDCIDPVVRSMLCDFADWAGAGNISEGGNHIRQRLYFVGLADSDGRNARAERQQSGGQYGQQPTDRGAIERMADPMHAGRPERGAGAGSGPTAGLRAAGGLDDDDNARSQGHAGDGGAARREGSDRSIAAPGVSVGLADDHRWRCGKHSERDSETDIGRPVQFRTDLDGRGGLLRSADAAGSGRYAKDWLFCRDGRWRAAQPGTFPLSYGVAARVGKLRAFGNALDAETATCFCEVVKEICDE